MGITYCFVINASRDIGDSNYSSDNSVYQNVACLTLFYTSLIPDYSKRNEYCLVASCKSRHLEKKKRVEQGDINKNWVRETAIAFSNNWKMENNWREVEIELILIF